MAQHHIYTKTQTLTKNMILYPGLFPNQGMEEKYDKWYAHSLILDMMQLGIELESWTEVEGGTWLPASYLFKLIDNDRGKNITTLWEMTKIHSLLFRYPSGNHNAPLNHYSALLGAPESQGAYIRWDNISGFSPCYASERVKKETFARNKKYQILRRAQLNDTTVCVRGLEFEVMYSVESYGCMSNGWDEPGEAAQVCLCECWTEVGNGERVDIDLEKGFEKLVEEIEQEIIEHVHESQDDLWPDDWDY